MDVGRPHRNRILALSHSPKRALLTSLNLLARVAYSGLRALQWPHLRKGLEKVEAGGYLDVNPVLKSWAKEMKRGEGRCQHKPDGIKAQNKDGIYK